MLATKAYMNDFVKRSLHLDDTETALSKVPFIQIMSFESQLSITLIKDRGVYMVEDLIKFRCYTIQRNKSDNVA